MDDITKYLLDPNGPLGLSADFFLNVVAEFGGFILGALVFSILIPIVIDARQAAKWRPARLNYGQELMLLHVAFGDALSRFLRSPAGDARGRAADAVDYAFRAVPLATSLFGYALTATISREVNDYMRMLRAIRDWAHIAAHPEDIAFATIERRVTQTRDMFEGANKEFKDVLDALGLAGFNEVRWSDELVTNLSAAFDLVQREGVRAAAAARV
jgi:hypothetical protein